MRKNKLMISAITLAFAVVAVVSTTFAWFTMNTETTVEDLEFNAASSTGLYMSLDGTNWKTRLTAADLKAYEASLTTENSKPDNIKGFASDFILSPATLLKSKHDTENKTVSLVDQANAASNGYVTFTIYFKSDVKSDILVNTLSVESEEVKNFEVAYNKDTTTQNTFDEFWMEKDGAEKDGKTILSTKLSNAVRVHLGGAVASELMIDPSMTENQAAGFGGILPGNESYSHQYLKHVSYNEAVAIEGQEEFGYDEDSQEFTNVYSSYSKFEDNSYILTLEGSDTAGYSGSVTVTLWVEGFDSDCFDILFNTSLEFNLKFEAITPVQRNQ